ncbi:MAG: DUF1330 domain-containing protein [bacterium]|nr:DUF1330 domain-containing protein [bacterium]
MSVYMIIEAKEIIDQEQYGEYIKRVPKIVAQFGGKYLARGGQITVACGDWCPSRLIIVEFASMDKYLAWWNSPEYKAIAPLRERSAKTNAIIVEGQEDMTVDQVQNLKQGKEAAKGFNLIMVLYYFGALLILSAFGWFMVDQWNKLGAGGILAVSLIYALAFVLTGRYLINKLDYPIAGGLLVTCAVGMTPLVVYSLQKLLDIWPAAYPGSYHDYYVWINGSWIVIELATVAASLLAIRKVKFAFLVMPAAIALWFLSMDIAQIAAQSTQISFEYRCWISLASGVIFILIGWLWERRSEGVDYPFWIYLAGLLAFWGGMTSLPSHGELSRFIYFLINATLVGLSLYLNRKTFAVFGGIGVFIYIGHLAGELFRNSIMFPFVMAFVGILIIWGAVWYQKNFSKLSQLCHSQASTRM